MPGFPIRFPTAADLPERIDAVLTVIYLVFTEGYAATRGEPLVRRDLCAEAIRLGRLVRDVDDARSAGGGHRACRADAASRLAARGAARSGRAMSSFSTSRIGASGMPIRLRMRCRSWTKALRGGPGPFALQAAIAALHCQAATKRGHRLAADRATLRSARARRAVTGRLAESGGRRSHGRWTDRGLTLIDHLAADGEPSRLPSPSRRPRRPAAADGRPRRRRQQLRAGAGARRQRKRAPVPRKAPAGGSRLERTPSAGRSSKRSIVSYGISWNGGSPASRTMSIRPLRSWNSLPSRSITMVLG